jgi:hypothetical protein
MNHYLKVLSLSLALGASGAAWADGPVAVSFQCDSQTGTNPVTHVKGVVTGPIAHDWSNPRAARGDVLIQVEGLEDGRVSMEGILLGARQYRDPHSGGWVYTPMRTSLQGQTSRGRKASGGFYFGMGRTSLLFLDQASIRLTCDFTPDQPEPQPSPKPSPSPTPSNRCHEDCRFRGGGHDGGRWVCYTVCPEETTWPR